MDMGVDSQMKHGEGVEIFIALERYLTITIDGVVVLGLRLAETQIPGAEMALDRVRDAIYTRDVERILGEGT
jgi:hypothetical protein